MDPNHLVINSLFKVEVYARTKIKTLHAPPKNLKVRKIFPKAY
jgi:hypothetical protein